MSTLLQIENFFLKRLTFEFRYEPAYILWDRSGRIWTQAKERWPDLINKSAQPNQTLFDVKDKFSMGVELEKSFIITSKPKLKEVGIHMNDFLNLVKNNLDISSYTRLGARFIFEKKFNDKTSACEAFTSLNIIKVPTGKHFGIEGKVVSPHCSYHWEGENIGIHGVLRTATQQFTIDVPFGIEGIDQNERKEEVIIFDIDYYTKVPTNIGQFSVIDWIKHANHLVKRDSKIFFGEN